MNRTKSKNSTKKTQNNDRVKFDMNQALMMREQPPTKQRNNQSQRIGSKRQSNTSALPSTSISFSETQVQVHASLRELDRAEDLASKHQYEEAQKIYTTHIETLIQILNEMKANTSLPSKIGVSRDVLRERIQVALTEAELIKEKIKQSRISGKKDELDLKKGIGLVSTTSLSRPTIARLPGNTTAAAATTRRKTTNAPSSRKEQPGPNHQTFRMFFGKSKSTNEVKTTQTRKSQHYDMPILKSKSTENKISHKTTPLATNTNDTRKQSTQSKRKSNLNYNTNDPLITTIKNDMYIDTALLTTSWNDIAGLVTAKQSLQEAAILPLLRPDLYIGLRSPPKGILLYGPPGTGKTMLVRATAHESQCILFACSASSMTSKWVGEGEKLVRTLFRMALDVAPSIIFIDEIDSLLGKRKSSGGDGGGESESSRRFKTEFMIQMDGIAARKGDTDGDEKRKILLIGATNCPWDIDDAIMRRFQRRIYVPLPDAESRLRLWNDLISNSKNESNSRSGGGIQITTKGVNELVRLTEGFSCSDITSVANEASFYPLRDLGDIEAIKGIKTTDVRPIMFKDFKSAITFSKKSVSKELLDRYSQWEETQSTR